MDITDTDRLSEKLAKFSEIEVCSSLKEERKFQLLNFLPDKTVSIEKIVKTLNFKKEVYPSLFFEVSLKEKLFNLIEKKRKSWFTAMSFKRALSFAMMVILVSFSVSFFFVKTPGTYAKRNTYIANIEGQVEVFRSGESIKAEEYMLLKENDTIVTSNNTKAVIYFFDDSVCRLGEDTELKIDNLFINPELTTQTFIGLVVKKGRVWSKVVNLVDEYSEFKLKAGNVVTSVDNKAAFDVKVSGLGDTEIKVWQNNINLEFNNGTGKKVLTKGESVKVLIADNNNFVDQTEELRDEWILSNLKEDEMYMVGLVKRDKDEAKEKAGMLPENPLYSVKKISENVQLSMTFGDLEKELLRLEIADKRLFEAETLIADNNLELAREKIDEYLEALNEINERALIIGDQNPVISDKLIEMIREDLQLHKKRLSSVLPDESLYLAKKTVLDAEILFAGDEIEKSDVKSKQASDKLLEIEDLLEKGLSESALQHLYEYKNVAEEVVSEVKDYSEEEREELISKLLDLKIKELEILESMEGEENYPNELREEISGVKEEVVGDLNEVIAEKSKIDNKTNVVLEQDGVTIVKIAPATPEIEEKDNLKETSKQAPEESIEEDVEVQSEKVGNAFSINSQGEQQIYTEIPQTFIERDLEAR